MKYTSTRSQQTLTATQSILNGLASDGGLYVPKSIPTLDYTTLKDKPYYLIAYEILKLFLGDINKHDLKRYLKTTYSSENFHLDTITNLRPMDSHNTLLELFYGKTSAFKDQALSLYPYLLKASMEKHQVEHLTILTATSGDTGKAAMEAIANLDGLSIAVLFPNTGTSPIQKLQMNTQRGANVLPLGIQGNFDDAQNLVKAFFLNHKDLPITSANSINIARLLPQVVYYFDAYLRLNTQEKINIYVPTGNFGNILAAYIAKEMSLPINELIVCTNENHVLYDFFTTGVYDIKERTFQVTPSPSMDILISSNLERLLYLVFKDTQKVSKWMDELTQTQSFKLNKAELGELQKTFKSQVTSNAMTKTVIENIYKEHAILIDPHTATAIPHTLSNYHNLIVSTASPYKFPQLYKDMFNVVSEDDFGILGALEAYTHEPYPPEIKELRRLPIRFNHNLPLEEVEETLLKFIRKEHKV